MSEWSVQMVTAFGRGESLARALQAEDFDVQIFDLTSAFGSEYRRGLGPFPLSEGTYLPEHEDLWTASTPLRRGLTVWLKEGPVEFSGRMSHFFLENHAAFRGAVQNTIGRDFDEDWLRRFLCQFTSAFHQETWLAGASQPFTITQPLRRTPAILEKPHSGYENFRDKPGYHECKGLLDLQIESSRILEIEVEAGQPMAASGSQWIWCLSSYETEVLSPSVASMLFSSDVRRPEWLWVEWSGRAERGPWSEGFPSYTVVLEDVHLPWVYSNMFILEWHDSEKFSIWMKVPAESARNPHQREVWVHDVLRILNRRLEMAKWQIDTKGFGICPHSVVFPRRKREWAEPGWKNWDWIAPESIGRLDLGSRFGRELKSLQRIQNWRSDMLKKQGDAGDSAIHAP
ncbi:MAG: hypothetical protein AB7F86_20165 [Bdellovibrionales bacterium]